MRLVLFLLMGLAILQAQPQMNSRALSKPLLVGGQRFRDANRNGKLDPYEDWRLKPEARTDDLLARMTLAEKAGVMMHGTAPGIGSLNGSSPQGYDLDAAKNLITVRHVNSMITRLQLAPAALAAQNNSLQALAESTRLGIPLTVSSDPRHYFQYVLGASAAANGFSQWPETLGFGALGDDALTRRFAGIARQEYQAVGIHMALSPQADLATEPRWPRVTGTFGEDPELVRRTAQAYIEGFQNGANGLKPGSVAAIVKHWVGYGAAKHGFDSHSYFGRFAEISENALGRHLRPFEGAFAARVAGVMPTYSILENLVVEGKPVEQVGAGFNRWLLTDLLRGKFRYPGLILSDWAITNDCGDICRNGFPAGVKPGFQGISMAWGVESLSAMERFAKGVNAGLDQFGGTEDSASLVAAVKGGLVTPKRLDESVKRILLAKFQQGLFENPYVDEEAARTLPGNEAFVRAGRQAQAKAMVVLENKRSVLPLVAPRKLLLRGIDQAAAQAAGFTVVSQAADADVAIIRTATPHQVLHPNFIFGLMHHEGDLDFKNEHPDLKWIETTSARLPVIVAIYLDRPAILTNIVRAAAALVANFGASDGALFDALTGRQPPVGKLPFELPRSMEAVRSQRSDTPHDSRDPLFPVSYSKPYGAVR